MKITIWQKAKKDQSGNVLENNRKIWLEDREISIKAWEHSRVGICKASSKTEGVKTVLQIPTPQSTSCKNTCYQWELDKLKIAPLITAFCPFVREQGD